MLRSRVAPALHPAEWSPAATRGAADCWAGKGNGTGLATGAHVHNSSLATAAAGRVHPCRMATHPIAALCPRPGCVAPDGSHTPTRLINKPGYSRALHAALRYPIPLITQRNPSPPHPTHLLTLPVDWSPPTQLNSYSGSNPTPASAPHPPPDGACGLVSKVLQLVCVHHHSARRGSRRALPVALCSRGLGCGGGGGRGRGRQGRWGQRNRAGDS